MDYEAHALEVMKRIGLGVRVKYVGHACPKWCDGQHIHGYKYHVTLRKGGQELTFPYWNSLHDKETGKHPSPYDVLSCVTSNASMPTDPDEVVSEFGDMKPSQAIAIAKWAKKLQEFFTPGELDALREIQ